MGKGFVYRVPVYSSCGSYIQGLYLCTLRRQVAPKSASSSRCKNIFAPCSRHGPVAEMRASEAICVVLPTGGTFHPGLGGQFCAPFSTSRGGMIAQGLESEIAYRGVCISEEVETGWQTSESRTAAVRNTGFSKGSSGEQKTSAGQSSLHTRGGRFQRDQHAACTCGRRRRATRGHPRSRIARRPFKRRYNAGERGYDHAALSPTARKAELCPAAAALRCTRPAGCR